MHRPLEVAPDVFRLGSHLFNCYLVREGDRFTLVDGGLPGYWSHLTDTLSALGATVRDVEAVLITHAHLDHVGFADRVRKESGARIFLHSADQARARRGGAQLPPTGLLLNAWRRHPSQLLFHATRYGVFSAPPIHDFTPVDRADTLDVPGGPTVLHVPGHTPGSVAYWFTGSRALLAGDALVTIDMFSGRAPRPQLTPWGTNSDPGAAMKSLERFEGLGEAVLLTGHGDPWEGDLGEAVAIARGSV